MSGSTAYAILSPYLKNTLPNFDAYHIDFSDKLIKKSAKSSARRQAPTWLY